MQDLRQNPAWGEHLKYKGWKADWVKSSDGRHKIQLFVLRLGWWPFSMMKVQRSNFDPDFTDLKRLKKKYFVANSIIEPQRVQCPEYFGKAGYRKTRFPYMAMSTYINDLTKSEKEMWSGLSENAKRLITKNKETKIIETSPEVFCNLWKKSTKIWIMKPGELDHLLTVFKGKAKLVLSQVGEDFHSGLLVIYTKDTAFYYQTWTSEAGRKSGAHYKLVWEEILRAKKEGLKYFDFEGVYDERWPQKKWKGFTEFKRRFGGELVRFPGGYFRWL